MTARTTCKGCGFRLDTVYPGQEYHPLCDPDPPVWTDEQLDEWEARAAALRAAQAEAE